MSSRRYTPLADYGAIGDGRSAALVGRDGSVDWWCLPRFDGPSVFARLLDERIGGFCSVAPAGAAHESPLWRSSQRYLDRTNVLVTEFEGADAGLRVTDLAPLSRRGNGGDPSTRSWPGPGSTPALLRRAEALGGPVQAEIRFAPRFDYARREPRLSERAGDWVAASGSGEFLTLQTDRDLPLELDGRRDEVRARFRLEPGEPCWVGLRPGRDHGELLSREAREALRWTTRRWREWSGGLEVFGPRPDLVRRSALTLRLLLHGPTGALLAAATTSLPSERGGPPGPDDRLVRLEDLPPALRALEGVGARDQVDLMIGFLERLLPERDGPAPERAVDVDGNPPARQAVELEHLRGYRGAHPPRVDGHPPGSASAPLVETLSASVRTWLRRGRLPERLRGPAEGSGGSGPDGAAGGGEAGAAGGPPRSTAAVFEESERLAWEGRRDAAVERFEAGVRRAGSVGLLAARVDPGSGEPLGNVPRARSHAALVNAARALAAGPAGGD